VVPEATLVVVAVVVIVCPSANEVEVVEREYVGVGVVDVLTMLPGPSLGLVQQARQKIEEGVFLEWKNKMVKIVSTRL
jgi:hypothetical protein